MLQGLLPAISELMKEHNVKSLNAFPLTKITTVIPRGRNIWSKHLFCLRSVERVEFNTEQISGVRRKFSWRGFHSVAFVFGVHRLWHYNLTSYSCFQAKFVDKIGIFLYTYSPYFCNKSSPIHSPYNKVFVKYQAQRGELTPTPPLAYALGADASGHHQLLTLRWKTLSKISLAFQKHKDALR